MPIIEIPKEQKEKLIISSKIPNLCLKKGGSFKQGCPNYGIKEGCPPKPTLT